MLITGSICPSPGKFVAALRIVGGASDAAEAFGRDIDFAWWLASVRGVH